MRASESPACTMCRAAESALCPMAQTFCTPAVARCGRRIMTAPMSAGSTDGRSRYVRAHTSDVLISLMTVPIGMPRDRKSTRLNSSHMSISYAVFCLKKKKKKEKGGVLIERIVEPGKLKVVLRISEQQAKYDQIGSEKIRNTVTCRASRWSYVCTMRK